MKAIQEAEQFQTDAKNAKLQAEKANPEAKVNLQNFTAIVTENKCTHCDLNFDSVAEMTGQINEVNNYPSPTCA